MRRTPPLPASRPVGPAPRALCLAAALLVALLAGGGGVRAKEAQPPPPAVDTALTPLRPWLSHEDWTFRSLAGFELRRRAERGVILLATEVLAKEEHPYAAAAALGALRGRPRRELVLEGGCVLAAALLRLAGHEHPTVAAYAREVLFRIPPVKLGTDLSRYEGWWARGEDALAREQAALLRETARELPGAGAPSPGSSSSAAPVDKSKDFYERLELMRSHGLELCIVMDDTGSMRPAIQAARVGATRMIARLGAFLPRFRAALVSYKDTPYFRIGLTGKADRLQRAFDKMAASGGGDLEEGVYPGIRMALEKPEIAWSRDAYRVIVVIGDAPPHERHLLPLLRLLEKQKEDLLYAHPVVVHTVSTSALPVLHFPQIARAGGGQHLTLADAGALVNALVVLALGGQDRERVEQWMAEIDALRAAETQKR